MTPEDKQLLLTDLCARLPYGVMVYDNSHGNYGKSKLINIGIDGSMLVDNENNDIQYYPIISEIKPYLRPLSSMTEEEKGEASKLGICYDGAFHNDIYDVRIVMEEAFAAISWLLERHFDINYLIHKGLALEAPEGMYN